MAFFVRRGSCLAGLFLVLLPGLWSQDLLPQVPSAVLLDQTTGRILYQKNPDAPIAPASLTKLMTLHLAWKALADGSVRPGDLVAVTAETTGSAVPPGSSLMFLEPGQTVTVRELMLGLAVDSGNDAGMTLAQHLAGSQEAFVARMNAEARALGLARTRFFDAYGYDGRNRTTAADFAQFCRYYLGAHPQSLEVLHSVRELAYPLDGNRAPGDRRRARTIVQANRNTLLGAYPGADGLKTGYIEESGYNLAATARRGAQRLVAVLMGIQAPDSFEGTRIRTASAAAAFDFGFARYPLRALPLPELPPVRVWYGDPSAAPLAPAGPAVYPLSDPETQGITVRVEGPREVLGPVPAGTVLGHLVWSREGRDFFQTDLKAAAEVRAAPWWSGIWDALVLFFRGLTGTPAPQSASPRTGS